MVAPPRQTPILAARRTWPPRARTLRDAEAPGRMIRPGAPSALQARRRYSFTWHAEQKISLWHLKQAFAAASSFFTMVGWNVSHGWFATAPGWWQLSHMNWLWQFSQVAFTSFLAWKSALCVSLNPAGC